jgi:hypothetical protein
VSNASYEKPHFFSIIRSATDARAGTRKTNEDFMSGMLDGCCREILKKSFATLDVRLYFVIWIGMRWNPRSERSAWARATRGTYRIIPSACVYCLQSTVRCTTVSLYQSSWLSHGVFIFHGTAYFSHDWSAPDTQLLHHIQKR